MYNSSLARLLRAEQTKVPLRARARDKYCAVVDLLGPKSVQYSTLTHLRHDAESLFNCAKGRRRQCSGRLNIWWV
jgi:hypothetical protein